MKTIFLSAIISVSSFSLTLAQEVSKKPNILFCIADDWGWPHASAYGDKVVKTPTFDRIASKGTLFQHAYVSAPSCTPSRNAILTGKYHWQLGQGVNLWSEFPKEHQTYPRQLEQHGYFIGSYRKSFGPGKDLEKPVAGIKFESPDAFFKARPKHQPFCFWFGASDPHRGYVKGSGKKAGIDPNKVEVPLSLPNVAEIRSDIADYYFEVQRFDKEVGELLTLLETQGELENTIVIMTGDHGYPFPRGKSNLYDLGTRVPLAIMWGERLKHPTYTSFVSLVDIAPTIHDLTHTPPSQPMSGRSLKKILQQGADKTQQRESIVFGKERHTPCQVNAKHGYPMRGIRNHQYLYIYNFEPSRAPAGTKKGPHRKNYGDIDGSPTKGFIIANRNTPQFKKFFDLCIGQRPQEELYDCVKDPDQITNLASLPEFNKIKTQLKQQLFNQLKELKDLRAEGRGGEYEQTPYKFYPSDKK